MSRHFFAVAALATVALPFFVASPASGQVGASCKQWNVQGVWNVGQSTPADETLHFKQTGTTLSGKAVNSAATAQRYGYKNGTITGTLKGSHLDITVHWDPTAFATDVQPKGFKNIGHYVGTVSAKSMSGTGNNLAYMPTSFASWSAAGTARCVKH